MPPSPTTTPRLWNPNSAALWSIVFSPAFGAFLHARNAEALGRTEEARTNTTWFYGTIVVLAGELLVAIAFPAVPNSAFDGLSIGMLAVWYGTTGVRQAQYVKNSLHGHYEHRHWWKPLLIALVCYVLFVIVGAILPTPQ